MALNPSISDSQTCSQLKNFERRFIETDRFDAISSNERKTQLLLCIIEMWCAACIDETWFQAKLNACIAMPICMANLNRQIIECDRWLGVVWKIECTHFPCWTAHASSRPSPVWYADTYHSIGWEYVHCMLNLKCYLMRIAHCSLGKSSLHPFQRMRRGAFIATE